MYKYLVALSPLVFALNAPAAINFQGSSVTAKAEVTIKQKSDVGLSVANVNNQIPENDVTEKFLFSFDLTALNVGTKVAIAGGNQTIIDGNGFVYSNIKDDGTKLIAQLSSADTALVSTDKTYLPQTANQADGASALLVTSGQDFSRRFSFNGADVPQNVTPGKYTFSFVAQAYTE